MYPLTNSRRIVRPKKKEKVKNRMGFEPTKRLDSLDGIGTGGEGDTTRLS